MAYIERYLSPGSASHKVIFEDRYTANVSSPYQAALASFADLTASEPAMSMVGIISNLASLMVAAGHMASHACIPK